MRDAHAALSPSFGAFATPAVWHAVQTVSKVFLPAPASAVFAEAAGAGGGGTAEMVGTAGAAAGGGVLGAGAGALGSIATRATGAMRWATRSGRMMGSSLSGREP